jgi:hypothetical protein
MITSIGYFQGSGNILPNLQCRTHFRIAKRKLSSVFLDRLKRNVSIDCCSRSPEILCSNANFVENNFAHQRRDGQRKTGQLALKSEHGIVSKLYTRAPIAFNLWEWLPVPKTTCSPLCQLRPPESLPPKPKWARPSQIGTEAVLVFFPRWIKINVHKTFLLSCDFDLKTLLCNLVVTGKVEVHFWNISRFVLLFTKPRRIFDKSVTGPVKKCLTTLTLESINLSTKGALMDQQFLRTSIFEIFFHVLNYKLIFKKFS